MNIGFFKFNNQEERIEKQEELKSQASKEIEDLLSGKTSPNQYRNVAVDRNAKPLKDDRFKIICRIMRNRDATQILSSLDYP